MSDAAWRGLGALGVLFFGYLLWTWSRRRTCQQQLEALQALPDSVPRTVQSEA